MDREQLSHAADGLLEVERRANKIPAKARYVELPVMQSSRRPIGKTFWLAAVPVLQLYWFNCWPLAPPQLSKHLRV